MRARVVSTLTGLCLGLRLVSPRDVHAEERHRLALEADSTCPSQALIATELSPLLRVYELSSDDPELTAQVTDLGSSYRISVAGATREVNDPERRCLERARVAAVFLALNLPQPAAPAPVQQPPALPPAKEAPEPAVTAAPARSRRALALRGFGRLDMTPETNVSATGAGGGLSLELGPMTLSLMAATTTPTRPYQADGDPPRFALRRVPLGLLLGWETDWGVLGVGGEAGLALDLLSFQGEKVPNPDTAFRLNAGLRIGAALRVFASRRLQAELVPDLSVFPRTYIVRVDPGQVLAETPKWWLGFSLGLRYSVWGE